MTPVKEDLYFLMAIFSAKNWIPTDARVMLNMWSDMLMDPALHVANSVRPMTCMKRSQMTWVGNVAVMQRIFWGKSQYEGVIYKLSWRQKYTWLTSFLPLATLQISLRSRKLHLYNCIPCIWWLVCKYLFLYSSPPGYVPVHYLPVPGIYSNPPNLTLNWLSVYWLSSLNTKLVYKLVPLWYHHNCACLQHGNTTPTRIPWRYVPHCMKSYCGMHHHPPWSLT